MKSKLMVLAAALAASLAVGGARAEDLCREPVLTREGPVLGMAVKDGAACAYLGIPYAAAPTGDLRFRPPVQAPVRSETLEAVQFGPSCIQAENISGGGKSRSFSEDCLSLNVWRPARSGAFPVMFWIHGGAYTQGAGTYEMYDGSRLAAEREVVVVTINYRLGALGFLALPELAKEDPHGSAGNYGLLDQIAALKWVQANIARFAGDPDNVTIFGESAGGVSVCLLLASPLAAGTFHRAVIESGGCDLVETLEKGYAAGQRAAAALGCDAPDPLACLRQLPAPSFTRIKSASAHLDGYAVPRPPLELFRQGQFNRVPVMVGSNKNEGNIILALTGADLLPGRLVEKVVRKALGQYYDPIAALYDEPEYRRPIKLVLVMATDGFGSRAFAAAEDLGNQVPVYYYRFEWDDELGGKRFGAFHGLEIPFVFGNLDLTSQSSLKLLLTKRAVAKGRGLAEAMMTYWTNFAKTGNPNAASLPEWPPYHTTDRQRIYLDADISVAPLTALELQRYQYFASLPVDELMGALNNAN